VTSYIAPLGVWLVFLGVLVVFGVLMWCFDVLLRRAREGGKRGV
jgi:hypothetical protein